MLFKNVPRYVYLSPNVSLSDCSLPQYMYAPASYMTGPGGVLPMTAAHSPISPTVTAATAGQMLDYSTAGYPTAGKQTKQQLTDITFRTFFFLAWFYCVSISILHHFVLLKNYNTIHTERQCNNILTVLFFVLAQQQLAAGLTGYEAAANYATAAGYAGIHPAAAYTYGVPQPLGLAAATAHYQPQQLQERLQ